MKTLIMGAGEVGRHIAETLIAEEQDVVLIEQDETLAAQLQNDLDCLVIGGNGASPRTLEEAGAATAQLLLAVSQNDEANLIAAMIAHQMGTARTVARLRDTEFFGRSESFAHDVLGIDFVIHPERITADAIAEAIALPGAVHAEHFAEGQLTLAECPIGPDSPLAHSPLRERHRVRPHFVIGLIRDGETLIPDGYDPVRPGDKALVVTRREHAREVVADLVGVTTTVREVVIFGGGRIGQPLAKRLCADGFKVKILERSLANAERVAAKLPKAAVIYEENAGEEAMRRHGVDRAQAFVACAGDDRTNLLAALNAERVGGGLCLATVSREEFMPLVDGLGLDGAFSSRLITAEAILRFVRGEGVEKLHVLLGGAEVLEIEIGADSPLNGRLVYDHGLGDSIAVAAVLRAGEIIFSNQGQHFETGDRVLLFGLPGATHDLEQTLRPRRGRR